MWRIEVVVVASLRGLCRDQDFFKFEAVGVIKIRLVMPLRVSYARWIVR